MTRILTATPALLAAAAAVLLAAYAAAHHVRRPRPVHPVTTGPRKVVEAALWDWWLTTDPHADYDPADVAARIDEYLRSSGFTIAPDIRKNRMPTRRSIAAVALIALVCAGSAVLAAWRGDWWWTGIGALGAALLTREVIRDLADRRHGSTAR